MCLYRRDPPACVRTRRERLRAWVTSNHYYYDRGATAKLHRNERHLMKRIHKVAVLGAGTMGARIAAHFANAGVASSLLDIASPGHDAASRNKIAAAGLEAAKKSKPAAFFGPSLARLVTIGNFEDDL